MKHIALIILINALPGITHAEAPWLRFAGKTGSSGWCCNVIQTNPKDHGPDVINIHDWDGDKINDLVITGGSKGNLANKLIVLLRTNKSGDPTFKEILIDQPCGNFPKDVAVIDLDADQSKSEILVIPKQGDIWTATYTDESMLASSWKSVPIKILGAETRRKMDNAWLGYLDGDADLDVVTTEENGGWGVIWFENPHKPLE